MDHIAIPFDFGGIIALIIACVAGIAWLVRVEVKGFYTRKDVERVEDAMKDQADKHELELQRVHDRIDGVVTKHDELNEKVMDKLSTIERMVSRIEGQINK